MSEEVFGRTRVCEVELSYTWTIEKFSLLPCERGDKIKSTVFSVPTVPETRCILYLYPAEHPEYIGLYLKKISGDIDLLHVNLEFLIKDSQGVLHSHFKQSKLFKDIFGSSNLVRRSALTEQYLAPDDVLHILSKLCVRYVTSKPEKSHVPNSDDHRSLSSDLKELYLSRRLSDVTLCVEDDQFEAHKNILSARSPVFASMFQHQLMENATNEVVIKDISTPALRSMLYYLYSGELVSDLTVEDYLDLYSAADKYAVSTLKLKCTRYLVKHLNVDDVCEVYIRAHLHNDDQLKEAAVQYIRSNVSTVFSSEGWNKMLDANGRLASEILREVSNETVIPSGNT